MRLLSLLLAVACGGNAVRDAHPAPAPAAPPPAPMTAQQVCPGATSFTEYDVPKYLCPQRTEANCDCAGRLSYVFCEDPYYYDYFQQTWLSLCEPP